MHEPIEISIRAPLPADGPPFTAAMVASAALHDRWIAPAASAAAYAAWLERCADGRCEHRLVLAGGEIAGFVTISEIVRASFRNAFISYGGVERYAGRGIMTAGMRRVLDETFGPLGLHRVEANIQPENSRSLALARRLGFTREGYSEAYLRVDGQWRDHERWALRSEQWLATENGRRAGYAPDR